MPRAAWLIRSAIPPLSAKTHYVGLFAEETVDALRYFPAPLRWAFVLARGIGLPPPAAMEIRRQGRRITQIEAQQSGFDLIRKKFCVGVGPPIRAARSHKRNF